MEEPLTTSSAPATPGVTQPTRKRKSTEERINDVNKELESKKKKLKALKAKYSKEERNKRTRRLVELGAVMEKIIGPENNTPEFRQALISYLTKERTDKNGTSFTNAKRILTGTLSEMKLLSEKP